MDKGELRTISQAFCLEHCSTHIQINAPPTIIISTFFQEITTYSMPNDLIVFACAIATVPAQCAYALHHSIPYISSYVYPITTDVGFFTDVGQGLLYVHVSATLFQCFVKHSTYTCSLF